MNNYNIIAGRIMRQKRKQARMTQSDVAKKVGVRQTAISNIEIGQNGMDFPMFRAFCKAVGCDPGETASEIFKAFEGGDYR